MLRYMALINSSYCKANKGDAGLCEILQFTLAETACAEHREAPPTPPENWELAVSFSVHLAPFSKEILADPVFIF